MYGICEPFDFSQRLTQNGSKVSYTHDREELDGSETVLYTYKSLSQEKCLILWKPVHPGSFIKSITILTITYSR